MNGFGERQSSWSSWSGGDFSSSPSEVEAYSREGNWKDLGTSVSAISFGLAATAILISMFLIMAIFEHVIKPRTSFLRSRSNARASLDQQSRPQIHLQEKCQNASVVGAEYTCDLSVLMPGEDYPTFIAQPAPLHPCPREGVFWPSHELPRPSSYM